MKKYIRLTESELVSIVKKVIKEQKDETQFAEPDPEKLGIAMNTRNAQGSTMAEDFDELEEDDDELEY